MQQQQSPLCLYGTSYLMVAVTCDVYTIASAERYSLFNMQYRHPGRNSFIVDVFSYFDDAITADR